jgi:hypothetical protein
MYLPPLPFIYFHRIYESGGEQVVMPGDKKRLEKYIKKVYTLLPLIKYEIWEGFVLYQYKKIFGKPQKYIPLRISYY